MHDETTAFGTQISLVISESYLDAYSYSYSAAGPLYERTDDNSKL